MGARAGAAPNRAVPADAAPAKEGGDPAYQHLTLDAVARRHHEVNYEEVADAYGGPMSRGPLVSVKAHPEIVWGRPDMGVGMVANPLAFGIGNPPALIRWRDVERSLLKGYLPILINRYQDGGLRYEQVLYATLLDGGEVRTGHEKQVVVIRMSVVNTNFSDRRHAAWWAFTPAAVTTTDGPPYFWSYKLFDVTGSLPPLPEASSSEPDGILRDGSTLLGIHEEGPGVTATPFAQAIRFEMDLLPGQKKSVCLKLSSNKHGLRRRRSRSCADSSFSRRGISAQWIWRVFWSVGRRSVCRKKSSTTFTRRRFFTTKPRWCRRPTATITFRCKARWGSGRGNR
jgi:hypothetical protein